MTYKLQSTLASSDITSWTLKNINTASKNQVLLAITYMYKKRMNELGLNIITEYFSQEEFKEKSNNLSVNGIDSIGFFELPNKICINEDFVNSLDNSSALLMGTWALFHELEHANIGINKGRNLSLEDVKALQQERKIKLAIMAKGSNAFNKYYNATYQEDYEEGFCNKRALERLVNYLSHYNKGYAESQKDNISKYYNRALETMAKAKERIENIDLQSLAVAANK